MSDRPAARHVSISRSGRFVAVAAPTGDALELVDALGAAPRVTIARPGGGDFACVGETLWLLDGATLRRVALDSGRALDPDVTLPAEGQRLRPIASDHEVGALVLGARTLAIAGSAGRLVIDDLDVERGATPWPIGGRRVLRAAPGGARIVEHDRGEVTRLAAIDGDVLEAAPLFGGRAIAALVRGDDDDDDDDAFVICRSDGGLIHRIAVPPIHLVAIADRRGIAIAVRADGALTTIDLRYGRILADGAAPFTIGELAIDAAAQHVVLAGDDGDGPAVLHVPITDVFVATTATRRVVEAGAEPAPADAASARGGGGQPPDEPAPAPPPVPALVPLALGRPMVVLDATAPADAVPYHDAAEHLDELLDVVTALAGRAVAQAWNSGRLSAPGDDDHPFAREVGALLGRGGVHAADEVREAQGLLRARTERVALRARATLAAGTRLPLIELAHQLDLTAVATQVLAVAIAPAVRGEAARLYGILSNDESRSLCDVHLVEQLIAGDDRALRREVAAALMPDRPLVRHGLVRLGASRGGARFAAVTVDEVLIERLRGDAPSAGLGDAVVLRHAARGLDELRLPVELKRELVLACADPGDGPPLRLVLRGRRASGRTSAIAALAAQVGHAVSVIDAARLPTGRATAAALRLELDRAWLRASVPVVSGLDALDPTDAEAGELVRQALRAHPGPVILRAAPEATLPLDPGHAALTVPPLGERARAEHWTEALARRALPCATTDDLAARWRIGPGIVEDVASSVARRRAREGVPSDVDAAAMLDAAARQHVASRLSKIATHVTRLASWEQAALPDDILDSLRELVGRIRHRRTVYDQWGFDAKLTTARGLTALFYGPPGTGKSMVAGLIARELGLELYRIDLARLVSKWIGETEKNLAEVFDAAEDGQIVILFDEADSLFAKRTEVKSSVDRYANLEVNYLLQRLDTFEGIAILTTNLEGSIDPAFKRRMSLRMQFPFPDEDLRARLWAAHIPADTPTAGDFDFADLARRFPLSGGYIRNSALRAAFLAAQEQRPLGQGHLERAIQLEYRELGKLSASGRME